MYPCPTRSINDAGVRTLAALVLVIGCGSKPEEAPLVKLSPQVEAALTGLGATCKDLRRIGGEPGAAPNVLQCQGTTAYASVNTYEHGEIKSFELALSGAPIELRALYAKVLEPVAGKDVVSAIVARIPDGGVPIETPELSNVGGIALMISSARAANIGWRYDVTVTWR